MPKNILVADDSQIIQKAVAITFAGQDVQVTFASNGQDALQKAKQLKPDVILADTFMPGSDGYQLCQSIKNDPSLKNASVLLLAGTSQPYDEVKGSSSGADGFIFKPFESQALIDRVAQLLSKAPAPAFVSTPTPSPASTIAIAGPYVPHNTPASDLTAMAIEAAPAKAPVEEFSFDLNLGSAMTETPTEEPSANLWGTEPDVSQSIEVSVDPVIELGEPEMESPQEEGFNFMDATAALPVDEGFSTSTDFGSEATAAIDLSPMNDSSFPTTMGTEIELETPESMAPITLDEPDPIHSHIPAKKSADKPTPFPSNQPLQASPQMAAPALSLSNEQIEMIVTKVFQNVIERIAWEVVPDMAEKIIREELQRLTKP